MQKRISMCVIPANAGIRKYVAGFRVKPGMTAIEAPPDGTMTVRGGALFFER